MKYKIGDWIVYIDKEWSKWWKDLHGVSLYGKIAKIIHIDNNKYYHYSLEFKEFIYGHNGNRKGREGHCLWCCKEKEFISLDQLKLKKLIRGE